MFFLNISVLSAYSKHFKRFEPVNLKNFSALPMVFNFLVGKGAGQNPY